jgi:hypothetical protein
MILGSQVGFYFAKVAPVDLASVLTHISVLPESFGQLSSLKTLRLEGNKLPGILFLVSL